MTSENDITMTDLENKQLIVNVSSVQAPVAADKRKTLTSSDPDVGGHNAQPSTNKRRANYFKNVKNAWIQHKISPRSISEHSVGGAMPRVV